MLHNSLYTCIVTNGYMVLSLRSNKLEKNNKIDFHHCLALPLISGEGTLSEVAGDGS